MDLTAEQFDDLVGAHALDACEPDEAAAVERYAATHAEASRELERLRAAAAGLGAAGALHPPIALRTRLLARATQRVASALAQQALADETERFDDVVRNLQPADLDVVTDNGLNVWDLVAHVEAIDRAFVDAVDDPTEPFIGSNAVDAITSRSLDAHRGETFAQTCTRFRRTRAELIGLGGRLPADANLAGYGRDDTLVIRAFETWTHNDDIRRALGREEAAPAAPVMRAMTELAMRSLPLAAATRGVASPGRTARFVLDGPGGGDWIIACAPGEVPGVIPDVVVRGSVVDFCRRFADRIAPSDLVVGVEGDRELASALLGAADAFAAL